MKIKSVVSIAVTVVMLYVLSVIYTSKAAPTPYVGVSTVKVTLHHYPTTSGPDTTFAAVIPTEAQPYTDHFSMTNPYHIEYWDGDCLLLSYWSGTNYVEGARFEWAPYDCGLSWSEDANIATVDVTFLDNSTKKKFVYLPAYKNGMFFSFWIDGSGDIQIVYEAWEPIY